MIPERCRVVDWSVTANLEARPSAPPGRDDRPCPPHRTGWHVGGMIESAVATLGPTEDYVSHRCIFDLHLEVARGEMLGFIGPNGAGKWTTIRLLMDIPLVDEWHFADSGSKFGQGLHRAQPSVFA